MCGVATSPLGQKRPLIERMAFVLSEKGLLAPLFLINQFPILPTSHDARALRVLGWPIVATIFGWDDLGNPQAQLIVAFPTTKPMPAVRFRIAMVDAHRRIDGGRPDFNAIRAKVGLATRNGDEFLPAGGEMWPCERRHAGTRRRADN